MLSEWLAPDMLMVGRSINTSVARVYSIPPVPTFVGQASATVDGVSTDTISLTWSPKSSDKKASTFSGISFGSTTRTALGTPFLPGRMISCTVQFMSLSDIRFITASRRATQVAQAQQSHIPSNMTRFPSTRPKRRLDQPFTRRRTTRLSIISPPLFVYSPEYHLKVPSHFSNRTLEVRLIYDHVVSNNVKHDHINQPIVAIQT